MSADPVKAPWAQQPYTINPMNISYQEWGSQNCLNQDALWVPPHKDMSWKTTETANISNKNIHGSITPSGFNDSDKGRKEWACQSMTTGQT